MRIPSLCIISLLFSGLALTVDHSKFRTCSQTPFCRQLREKNVEGNARVTGYDNEGNLSVSNGHQDTVLMLRLVNDKVLKVRVHREDVAHLVMEEYLPKSNEVALKLVHPISEKELHFALDQNIAVKVQIQPLAFTILQKDSIKVQLDSLILNEPKEQIEDEETNEEGTTKEVESKFVHARVRIENEGVLYGIPEHADSLALRETSQSEPYRLFNLDVYQYELDSPMALYGSIPYLISHGKTGSVGIFWNNPSETWVDVRSSSEVGIVSDSGNLEVFVMLGDSLEQVQQQYRDLTGPPAMPPMFALGYHQCRWNYKNEADVLEVDAKFDEENIPYDVIWLDIEHTHDKRYMTWHPFHFKTPKKMLKKLKQQGRQLVTIIDPHIKVDERYKVYRELANKDLLVKDAHGGVFDGHCWPGKSVWVDFVNGAARAEWSHMIQKYASQYPVHIWNDMNEPSVFSSPEITMPRDAQHTFKEDQKVAHHLVHNLYGALMHQSTFAGLSKAKKNRRPFVLSRSFYAGSQRYGAIWTGDNKAEWSHLRASVPMLLTMGMCGLPFVGADVGGFFGNPEPELLVRWYQTGALYPFFRGHAHIETNRREPWVFGDPYTSHIRNAIKLRYTLLPYIYTLFHETHVTGKPVMRSLGQEFNEEAHWKEDLAFMMGSALLHQPVTQPDVKEVDLIKPKNTIWYDFFTGDIVKDSKRQVALGDMILLVRGGSIIPIKEDVKRNTGEMQKLPFTLLIAPDEHGRAEGMLYVDDGESVVPKHSLYQFNYANGQLTITAKVRYYEKYSTVQTIILFGSKTSRIATDVNLAKKDVQIIKLASD